MMEIPMSRTYKNGQVWRVERIIQQDRRRDEDRDYPYVWKGRVFNNFDEYASWFLRQYTGGKNRGMVYEPWQNKPKGYNKRRRCTCCGGYTGPNKWWYKRQTARLMRNDAKDLIRFESNDLLHDETTNEVK